MTTAFRGRAAVCAPCPERRGAATRRACPRAVALSALLLVLPLAATAQVPADVTAASWGFLWAKFRGDYSVQERVAQYRRSVEIRLRPWVEAAGLRYPPGQLALVAFKDTRRLELYGRMSPGDAWSHVRTYPILGASGRAGPKLAEGDQQVPEGRYVVESLNPNSRFHLSLRLDYPNGFDRRMAAMEGRTNLGGDIAIHGSVGSSGCLAVGNAAAEDLFVLSALAPRGPVQVVIAPADLRDEEAVVDASVHPAWVASLYATLRQELRQFVRRY